MLKNYYAINIEIRTSSSPGTLRRQQADDTDLTDPTRGRHVLDLVVTNFNDLLEEAGVTDPMENDEGKASNHRVVHTEFHMPRVRSFKVHEYYYR